MRPFLSESDRRIRIVRVSFSRKLRRLPDTISSSDDGDRTAMVPFVWLPVWSVTVTVSRGFTSTDNCSKELASSCAPNDDDAAATTRPQAMNRRTLEMPVPGVRLALRRERELSGGRRALVLMNSTS
jgi:hypothetical protein